MESGEHSRTMPATINHQEDHHKFLQNRKYFCKSDNHHSSINATIRNKHTSHDPVDSSIHLNEWLQSPAVSGSRSRPMRGERQVT